jgi:hypothetical protein
LPSTEPKYAAAAAGYEVAEAAAG